MSIFPINNHENMVEPRSFRPDNIRSTTPSRLACTTVPSLALSVLLVLLFLVGGLVNASGDVQTLLEQQSRNAADATWDEFAKYGEKTQPSHVGAQIIAEFKPKSNLNGLQPDEIDHLSDFYHSRMDDLLKGVFPNEDVRRPILDRARWVFKYVVARPNENW
ncbi:MAG: hypothetical protein F4X56_08810 [Gammaproteobacteria bacterium]|nr:hypothetical protein [Gammaproteobacteria bacterium]MYC26000.1 hypothetical protein [Gammaproteobacteria bacterium]